MPENRSAPAEYVTTLLLDPGRRVAAFLVAGYLTGFGGVLLSFVGDPSDPGSAVGVAGIVLMGTSFVCMFVLSVTMANLTDGGR